MRPIHDHESRLYQQALATFCRQQNPDCFLTLRFNNQYPLAIDSAEKSLRHFSAQLDRLLLGNGWATFPTELRTRFIAIPEGRRACSGFLDLHYHLVMALALRRRPAVTADSLPDLASRFWTRSATSGDANVQFLHTDDDRSRVSSYVCKRISEADSVGLEHFVIGPMSSRSSMASRSREER